MIRLIWPVLLAADRKPDFGVSVNTALRKPGADDTPRTLLLPSRVPVQGQGQASREPLEPGEQPWRPADLRLVFRLR